MAPTLRSSVHGRRINNQSELPSQDQIDEDEMDYDEVDHNDSDLDQEGGNETDLRPIQETADRFGRQAEECAQAFDKFGREMRSLSGQKAHEATWDLISTYSKIAADTADRMTVSSKSTQKKDREGMEADRNNMVLEANIWELQEKLLPCYSPELVEDARREEQTALLELHRYSTNDDLWTAFVKVDRIAMQYLELLEWLQKWKTKVMPEPVDTDLEQYSQTQRGESYWDSGNIFTQAPIKRQKISRAHPGPLIADADLKSVHYRQGDQEALVAQMDPDAVLRQQSSLEHEDEIYEISAWDASWEMLTRGKTPDQVAEWWRERNELWRALAVRNAAIHHNQEIDPTFQRIASLGSNKEFFLLCQELADDLDAATEYEQAVFSILGGKTEHTDDVCKSVNDRLFVLVNSLLIERYQQFLQAYEHKLTNPTQMAYSPAASSIDQLIQFSRSAQTNQQTRAELGQPYKYLQTMVISTDLQTLLLDMGHAASKFSARSEGLALFEPDETPTNACALRAAQDQDVVRLAVHLQLALQPLGLLAQAYEQDTIAMENNIVNYIALLVELGKFALLPLYTSKLSPERQPRVLGRILSKVTDPKERDVQMRLMKSYTIPVHQVIYTICDYSRQTWLRNVNSDKYSLSSAKLIEHKDRIIQIQPQFFGEATDITENMLVQAHEWISYIDKPNWGMAAWLITALYKVLLLSGKLAVARELMQRIPLSETSMKVTGVNLSFDALLKESYDGDDVDEADDEDAGSKLASPSKRRKDSKSGHLLAQESTTRSLLAQQSTVWSHLEYLVAAMSALEAWQVAASEIESLTQHEPRAIKAAKKQLTAALQEVFQTMQPLLEEEFLNQPADEQEDRDLTEIRNHYLPECILAYNSALYFAGHTISRQHLVQCLELSQEIAQNKTLTNAFVASKRMRELVTAFAFDSQALLRANEHGSAASKRRGRRSKEGEMQGRPDIWQVTLPREIAENA